VLTPVSGLVASGNADATTGSGNRVTTAIVADNWLMTTGAARPRSKQPLARAMSGKVVVRPNRCGVSSGPRGTSEER